MSAKLDGLLPSSFARPLLRTVRIPISNPWIDGLSLAALAAAPGMPSALPAAPTSAAMSRFAAAKLIARVHNACSPNMLRHLLQVDASIAAELNAMLSDRGVITAAGSNGMSMAVNPMNTNCLPTEALKPTNMVQSVADVREKLAKLKESYADLKPEPNEPDTEDDKEID